MTTPDDAAPIVFERDGKEWTLLIARGEPEDLVPTQLDATPADLAAAGFMRVDEAHAQQHAAEAEWSRLEAAACDRARELEVALSAERLARAEVERVLREERDAWHRKAFTLAHHIQSPVIEVTRAEALALANEVVRFKHPDAVLQYVKAAEGQVEHRAIDLCPHCERPLHFGPCIEPQSPAGEKEARRAEFVAFAEKVGAPEVSVLAGDPAGSFIEHQGPINESEAKCSAGGGEERVTPWKRDLDQSKYQGRQGPTEALREELALLFRHYAPLAGQLTLGELLVEMAQKLERSR